MRSICKGGEPRALIEWKRQNAETPDNLHYNGGGFPREAVRQSLLLEQCHLCGYYLYPKNGKPLSAASARRLAAAVMRPDAEQCLPAYCVALASAALALAAREERRAARMRKQGTTR